MLRPLVSFFLLLLPAAASAQDCRRGYAVSPRLVTNTVNAQMAAGDFNGDGRLDFAASGGGGQLVTLLNRGGEVFEPVQAGVTNEWLSGQMHVAEVTGDRHLDLLVRESWTVAVAPGRGDGTFAPFVVTRDLPPTGEPLMVDLDGDRRPELVQYVYGEASVVMYTPERDGTFRLAASLRVAPKWDWDFSPLRAGDFDGDGRIDLASVSTDATKYARLHILWNEGNWTFTSQLRDWVELSQRNAQFGALQIDADAATELVALHEQRLHVFEANGRSLSHRTVAVDGPHIDMQRPLAARDLDRDGALDVVLVGSAAMTVLWSSRDGELGYTQAHFDFAPAALEDVNADGFVDILSQIGESVQIAYGGAGRRNLQAAPLVAHPGFPRTLFEADVNRDGRLDLVTGDDANHTVLLRAEGTSFREIARIGGHRVHAVSDLDEDGHLDLITRDREWEGPTHVHFGSSDFAFTPPLQVSANAWFEGVAARTGGGKSLIFRTLSGEVESVSLTHRTPAAAVRLTSLASRDEQVAVADVDGDGDSDLVLGDGAANRFLMQDASGWTSRAVEFPLDVRFDDVVPMDVERDGRVDLLLVSEGGYWPLLARGDGTYSLGARPYITGSTLRSLRLTDIDRDGLLDVVAAMRGAATHLVHVHRNTGSSFEAYGVFSVDSAIGGTIAVADADRDGWADLIVAHRGGSAILRNIACAPPRVRAAITPARPIEGAATAVTVNAHPVSPYNVGRIVVRRNGTIVHVEQPESGLQFAGTSFVLPPLAAGRHELHVEYEDQFAGTSSATLRFTVESKDRRRRAVRSR